MPIFDRAMPEPGIDSCESGLVESGVSRHAARRKSDHCTISRTAPTPHGTPKTTHKFAAGSGVLRTAAARSTP